MLARRGSSTRNPTERRRRADLGSDLRRFSGAIVVTELVDRLAMIKLLDAAIGPIKSRDRGFSGGQLLVGIAAAQLAGEDFLVGLDRQRADEAGQVLAVVPGWPRPLRPGWRAGSPTRSGMRWRPGSPMWPPRR